MKNTMNLTEVCECIGDIIETKKLSEYQSEVLYQVIDRLCCAESDGKNVSRTYRELCGYSYA